MSEKYIQIDACCYSEKTDAAIGFGIGTENSIDELGTDWIWEGLSESFWENYQEFEEGVAKAYAIVRDEVAHGYNDNEETFMNALHQVFGDFKISFTVDGEESKLDAEIDVNDAMYSMLPDICIDEEN